MTYCRDRTVVYPLLLSSQYYLWMQMWNTPWFPFPKLHLKVNTEAMLLDVGGRFSGWLPSDESDATSVYPGPPPDDVAPGLR